jgi:hypothetical protein
MDLSLNLGLLGNLTAKRATLLLPVLPWFSNDPLHSRGTEYSRGSLVTDTVDHV